MRRLFCLVIIALASASPARAACENLPQTEMNVCAGEAFQQADAALNALYQEIKQRLAGDAETTTLFVAAQRAWLPFRDAECKFAAAGVTGGSIYPTIYASCLERLTIARVADFKIYLACEEGDLSCPVPAP